MSSTLIHSPSLGIGNQRENGQSGKEGEGIRSQRKKKKKRKEAVWTRSSRAPDWIDMTLCVGSKKGKLYTTTTPGDGQAAGAGSSSLGVVVVAERECT